MMAQNAAMSMMGGMGMGGMGMGGMGMGGMGMGGMGMGGMAGQPQFMGPWTQMQNPLSNQVCFSSRSFLMFIALTHTHTDSGSRLQ
jgi:hypothetical protein